VSTAAATFDYLPSQTKVARAIECHNSWILLALGICGHVGLALLMYRVPSVGVAHAVLTLSAGIWAAFIGRRLDRLALVLAYMTGAEVLWRMTDATTWGWESSKYALTLFSLAGLFRLRRVHLEVPVLLYAAALVPGVVISGFYFGFQELHRPLGFNLSGALGLAACALFFRNVKLSRTAYWRVCLALAMPALGIAAIAASTTYTDPDIEFTAASNVQTSGGFGPNQVSAILALAGLFLIEYMLMQRLGRTRRLIIAAVAAGLCVQSAMTFSRGGLYSLTGALVAGAFFLYRVPRYQVKLIRCAVAVLTAAAIILPVLNAYTSGALTDRFRSTDMTGRDALVRTDLELWAQHPVYGVGVGVARFSHMRGLAAHTEYSRLLAEHGAFGALAIALLLWLSAQRIRRGRFPEERALSASHLAWSFLFMASNGMRLVAPSFAFGFAQCRVDD